MKDILDRAKVRAMRIVESSEYDARLLLECCVEIGRLRLKLMKCENGDRTPQIGDADVAVAELRAAGLDAWDDVPDPEALMREIRGE